MQDFSLPLYLFHQGTNFYAHLIYGAHPENQDGKDGYVFRVWAPRAAEVFVFGDFNGWDQQQFKMNRMQDGESFERFIPALQEYCSYKYRIITKDGRELIKADPYAVHTEVPTKDSENASKLYDLSGFDWKDADFIENRAKKDLKAQPMNIYEVNLLSWMKHPSGRYLSYAELAVLLVSYVKEHGYTHVELMPLTEFPYDRSWGYQCTGYFAVTSRLGTPKDFMTLVNAFHENGIGVILDWVPAHFPKDKFGLYEFDGGCLYESPFLDRIENKGWGTRMFDYGRTEVMSFLISSAVFLLETYHLDGLRVDAVSAMLYLNYEKQDGEWLPNKEGGVFNLEAMELLRRLNTAVHKHVPGVLTVAEESTIYDMVTKSVADGGLGFDFKWNMGWMNDSLRFVQVDPIYKRAFHRQITDTVGYAFDEAYILPISHDEVVYGKKSLLAKMPGNSFDRFATARAFLAWMYAYPGKKLNFMGNEFGQANEWDYQKQIPFYQMDCDRMHERLHHFTRELNKVYRKQPPLWERDCDEDGFAWISDNEADKNIFIFERLDASGERIVCAVNFAGVRYENYRLGLDGGSYRVLMNTDRADFGGTDAGLSSEKTKNNNIFKTENIPSHGRKNSILLNLPRLACIYLLKLKD